VKTHAHKVKINVQSKKEIGYGTALGEGNLLRFNGSSNGATNSCGQHPCKWVRVVFLLHTRVIF
jgi:hypothetical protein